MLSVFLSITFFYGAAIYAQSCSLNGNSNVNGNCTFTSFNIDCTDGCACAYNAGFCEEGGSIYVSYAFLTCNGSCD